MKKEYINTFEWQKVTDYLLRSLVAVPIEFPKRIVKSSVVTTTTRDCLSFKSRSLDQMDDNITVTVCADYEGSIVECIETNNCVTELWSSCTTTNSQFLQVQASSKGDGNVSIDALKGLLKFMTGWGKEVEEDAK